MNILAIDPGTEKSGVVVFNGERVIEASECANITVCSEFLCDEWDAVVCEVLECHGMPVGKETFETAYFIGRVMEKCDRLDVTFHRIYRSEVKQHLCHSARAKDGNVRQALLDRFGPKGTKKNPGALYGVSGHCWQALAVAVTWWDKQ